MIEPTIKQLEVLKYICRIGMDEWRAPTIREIAKEFGICKSATNCHIQALRHKGYLHIGVHELRATELTQERYFEEWMD